MNKKAAFLSMELPVWFFNLFVLIVIVVIFAIVVSSFLAREVDTSKYESLLILNNIHSCLSYTDERTDFGVIDINKFTNLNSCLNIKDIQYNLILEDLDGNNLGNFYSDKTQFELNWPLRDVNLENQEYRFSSGKDYTIINKEGKNQGAILTYNFIIKNV
ncbi:MAG: hypothetical protein PHD81_02195 [Candidatus Nanoarchaeia archaeon]|nr:hypothetical protein [Candidatus Nanoarchaeia archaeon]MDD5587901.1 hypothetical protein [Candidatus Nanoarchaeia archaeon]